MGPKLQQLPERFNGLRERPKERQSKAHFNPIIVEKDSDIMYFVFVFLWSEYVTDIIAQVNRV